MPVLVNLDELRSYHFSPLDYPKNVMMVKPDHFCVKYKINSYMEKEDGSLPIIDDQRARYQWDKLKSVIEELGLRVYVVPGQEDYPDMVFAANQVLPLDTKRVLAGKMAYKQRQGEVQYIADFFSHHGDEVKELPEDVKSLEGMGDAIWHHGMDLLWVGVGQRTSKCAMKYLADDLNINVIPLELVDPNFYHLDTCFSIIDSQTLIWCPKAFSERSQKLIESFFKRSIEIPYKESIEKLACNCWSVDGKNVIIQSGAQILKSKLESYNYKVHEVDTSEFIKAGGSVFCLKLAFF